MMVAEAQVAHKDAREKRSSDCSQSLMDWDIDVVPERLLRISWAFSRVSGNWSPICRRVVQVVHEWFDWFTLVRRWFKWFTTGSRGSPVVQVVHDWFT